MKNDFKLKADVYTDVYFCLLPGNLLLQGKVSVSYLRVRKKRFTIYILII